MSSLYETDLHAWAVQNAELVRERRFEEADLRHIAEELDLMAGRERRELRNRLEVLIAHLLKFQLRPEPENRSWWLTIREQRRQLTKVLSDNPSLKSTLSEAVRDSYRYATESATDEMLLDKSPFPAECPFTVEQILDPEFFPRRS